jgi:hypothetical protein
MGVPNESILELFWAFLSQLMSWPVTLACLALFIAIELFDHVFRSATDVTRHIGGDSHVPVTRGVGDDGGCPWEPTGYE